MTERDSVVCSRAGSLLHLLFRPVSFMRFKLTAFAVLAGGGLFDLSFSIETPPHKALPDAGIIMGAPDLVMVCSLVIALVFLATVNAILIIRKERTQSEVYAFKRPECSRRGED